MFVKKTAALLVALSLLWLIGCAGHVHTIGSGPAGHTQIEARQWYVIWGLIPINDVDSTQMVGDAADYKIKTEMNALDVIISWIGSFVTVMCRTVTVTK